MRTCTVGDAAWNCRRQHMTWVQPQGRTSLPLFRPAQCGVCDWRSVAGQGDLALWSRCSSYGQLPLVFPEQSFSQVQPVNGNRTQHFISNISRVQRRRHEPRTWDCSVKYSAAQLFKLFTSLTELGHGGKRLLRNCVKQMLGQSFQQMLYLVAF